MSTFELFQAWVKVVVTESGWTTFLPVDHLTITPSPYVKAGGTTAKQDVFGKHVYNNAGYHHNVTLEYDEIPPAYHDALRQFINELDVNHGRCSIYMGLPEHTGYDINKRVDVVADFGSDVLPVVFSKRIRQRPATLTFKGETPLAQPLAWLTE